MNTLHKPLSLSLPRASTRAPSPAAPPLERRKVNLPGVGQKVYTFPTRFQDVELLTAQIALPAKAVAQWLPPGLKPVSFAGVARGLVTVQRLGNPPDGMKPYTEASFAVRVRTPEGGTGWHTLTMPVDSFENKQRGLFLFGYPKRMASLSLGQSAHGRKGVVQSERGEPMLSLDVNPFELVSTRRQIQNTNYQELNGKRVRLNSTAEGRLQVGTAQVEFGEALRRQFPGLPAKPKVLFGGRLSEGKLALSLPVSPGSRK